MISKLLKDRRSKARRRKMFVEQLEGRALLAALQFDTALTSLNLSGGPYPMPLASDPGNALGDSISGYGLVNSQVTITLSSQRTVSPGPSSLGQACAFQGGIGTSAASKQGASLAGRGCFNGYGGGSAPAPIDPNALDGQPFFVDSFFDVFFDITVTDVDTRPGRNYPGMCPKGR